MKKGIAIVQTWGTNNQGKLGETVKYSDEYFGHTAIELRLADTPENLHLINNYCDRYPSIPYHIETETNNEGTKNKIYVVRFSFIPGNYGIGEPFHLNSTYKEDSIYAGQMHPDPLFPSCSLTEKGRALSDSTPEGKYIKNQKAIADCGDLINAIVVISREMNVLLQKRTEIDLDHPSSQTFLRVAKKLNLELPDLHKLSVEHLNELSENIATKKQRLTHQLIELRYQENQFKNFEVSDEYLSYGHTADAQIELSLGAEEKELNTASMLEQMRKIVDSAFEYDPHTHNSASTVLSILRAGRENKTSEPSSFKMLVSTFLPAANSRMVHNTAIEFSDKSPAQNAGATIQEQTTKKQKLDLQKSLIIGLLAAAGLTIGAGIGVALVATGVFAPLGVGVLGLVAVAGTLGGGLALISGALGVSAIRAHKPSIIPQDITVRGSYSVTSTQLNREPSRALEKTNIQKPTSTPSKTSVADEPALEVDLDKNERRIYVCN